MPLYEYRCKDCGEVFEKMVRWSETNHNPICPNCQSTDTHKKMSQVASFGSASAYSSVKGGSTCGTSGRFS